MVYNDLGRNVQGSSMRRWPSRVLFRTVDLIDVFYTKTTFFEFFFISGPLDL